MNSWLKKPNALLLSMGSVDFVKNNLFSMLLLDRLNKKNKNAVV
jgi:hypothetical protein